MRHIPPVEKVVLMMAMALGDGAVENDRLDRSADAGRGLWPELFTRACFLKGFLIRLSRKQGD
jgi:hypothetical protein